MMVGRIVLLALVLSCSGEPHADVRWLVNENTEAVMGLVGRGPSPTSKLVHSFVLLECASYDLFVTATEIYRQQGGEGMAKKALPRGCTALVETELSRAQLRESKKAVSEKLKKEKVLGGLLENLATGMNSGAVFSMLGISSKHTKIIKKAVKKLQSIDVLPHIPSQSKIKKGFVILSSLAMLVTSSGLLKGKGQENYQAVFDELSGAERSSTEDTEASQQRYEEVKQLMTQLLGEQSVQLDKEGIARAVAN